MDDTSAHGFDSLPSLFAARGNAFATTYGLVHPIARALGPVGEALAPVGEMLAALKKSIEPSFKILAPFASLAVFAGLVPTLAACSGGGSMPEASSASAPLITSEEDDKNRFVVKSRSAALLGSRLTTTPAPARTSLPVTGRPEPAFAPNPFVGRLTGNEPVDSNSVQEIAAMYNGHFSMSEIAVPAPGDQRGRSGETFSVAYATDLDPVFTIHCSLYSNCPEEGKSIHIPGGLMPADGFRTGGEARTIIYNWTEAREDGLYHLNQVVPMTGGPLNIGYGGGCDYAGYSDGKSCSEPSAGGIPVGGMLLRADELVAAAAVNGDLGHVLYITTCVSKGNQRFPATSGNGNGNVGCAPMGSRIVLRKTDSQIAALNVPEWDRVILRTMAHYGMMSDDNNNHTAWAFGAEDDNGRTSLGKPAVWPAAIALMQQDAAKYHVDLSISNGSYHIALPYDSLAITDMAVVSRIPLQ